MQASGTAFQNFQQFYLCLQCLITCSEFSIFLKLSSVLPSQMSHLLSHSVFSVPRSHFSDTDHSCSYYSPCLSSGLASGAPKRRACPGERHLWSQGQALSFSTFTPASEVGFTANRWWCGVPHPCPSGSIPGAFNHHAILNVITFWYIQGPSFNPKQ